MGKEAVVKMLNKADEGSSLRAELEAAAKSSGDSADAFLSVAVKHGFDFTPEEFKEVLAEAGAEPQSGELSDDDLKQVAGGVGFMRVPTRNLTWAFNIGPRIGPMHGSLQIGGPDGPPPP